jgi:hypothetical protein
LQEALVGSALILFAELVKETAARKTIAQNPQDRTDDTREYNENPEIGAFLAKTANFEKMHPLVRVKLRRCKSTINLRARQ